MMAEQSHAQKIIFRDIPGLVSGFFDGVWSTAKEREREGTLNESDRQRAIMHMESLRNAGLPAPEYSQQWIDLIGEDTYRSLGGTPPAPSPASPQLQSGVDYSGFSDYGGGSKGFNPAGPQMYGPDGQPTIAPDGQVVLPPVPADLRAIMERMGNAGPAGTTPGGSVVAPATPYGPSALPAVVDANGNVVRAADPGILSMPGYGADERGNPVDMAGKIHSEPGQFRSWDEMKRYWAQVKPKDPSRTGDKDNPLKNNADMRRPRTWQELTDAERSYFRSQYLTNSADAYLNQQQADADAAWRYGMMSMQPYTYSSGVHIPAGSGGGSPGYGGVPQVTVPGFDSADPTASAPSGTPDGSTATPTDPLSPPTYTPTPLPTAPTLGGTNGSSSNPQATGWANAPVSDGIPEWLRPFMSTGATGNVSGTPQINVPPINLPWYPTGQSGAGGATGGTTTGTGSPGGVPGPVTVPNAQMPTYPTLPTPILNLPGAPQFNPTPLPGMQNIRDLYDQLSGAGAPGAGGVAGGGVTGGGAGSGGALPGGTPGGGDAFLQTMYADYQRAMDESRAANEGRYNDILDLYGQRHNTAMENLGNLGLTERNRINENWNRLQGSLENDMMQRGLQNTTLRGQALQGITREQERAMGELQQRLNSTAIGLDAGLSGDMLGFMERREDVGPDPAFLAQLTQAMGEGGYGTTGAGSPPITPQGSGTGTATPAPGSSASSGGGSSSPVNLTNYAAPSPSNAGGASYLQDYYQNGLPQSNSTGTSNSSQSVNLTNYAQPTGSTNQSNPNMNEGGFYGRTSNSSGTPNSSSQPYQFTAEQLRLGNGQGTQAEYGNAPAQPDMTDRGGSSNPFTDPTSPNLFNLSRGTARMPQPSGLPSESEPQKTSEQMTASQQWLRDAGAPHPAGPGGQEMGWDNWDYDKMMNWGGPAGANKQYQEQPYGPQTPGAVKSDGGYTVNGVHGPGGYDPGFGQQAKWAAREARDNARTQRANELTGGNTPMSFGPSQDIQNNQSPGYGNDMMMMPFSPMLPGGSQPSRPVNLTNYAGTDKPLDITKTKLGHGNDIAQVPPGYDPKTGKPKLQPIPMRF